MRFNRKLDPKSDESGDETTLGSSQESAYSYGLFANQFSESSDCAHSPPKVPVLQSKLFTRRSQLMMPLRRENSDNMSVNNPLIESKINVSDTYDGYMKIPGRDEEKRDDRKNILSSSRYYDTYKYTKNDEKKQSSLVTIFAVWNTTMGSSLLTMAWGIERAGLIPGIFLMMSMGALCLYTSYILLKVGHRHGNNLECEVADLCRILLGRWAEVIAQIFSVIVMLGANIVYWVLMTNFLYYSVNYFRDLPFLNTTQVDPYGVLCPNSLKYLNFTTSDADIETTSWGGRFWDLYSSVPFYVAIIILPLLNFNTTSFFTKFNSLGTMSVLYLMIFVITKGAGWGAHIDSWMSVITIKTDIGVLSGMLALSFFIHNIIITVMKNNRHQENNGRDLSIAFVLITLTYMLLGSVFYICFPLAKTCIEDNMLNNFARGDIMTAIARILLLFQVITVYPLIGYMLRVQVLGSPDSHGKGSNKCYVLLFNIVMIAVCILFACFVPKIGTIIRYTGALSGLIHVFTLPSLLHMTSLYKRGKLSILKVLFFVMIFIIGACNLFAQFFVGD
ncbi:neutral amino acid transporter 9-like [Arctopsyche grandis]|uniref:neutral amino acid transporter 9-like n=1 Tax=Arctopsyche grandis TaxID=121162 RepID=UPI00406D8008